MWKLENNTNDRSKGYMRITKDGKRVADVFPYAPGQDVEWTIEAAQEIVDRMNEREYSVSTSVTVGPLTEQGGIGRGRPDAVEQHALQEEPK